MINKKSVLMTSKVNYGYFSGVGYGIAGNVLWLGEVGDLTHPSRLEAPKFNLSTKV